MYPRNVTQQWSCCVLVMTMGHTAILAAALDVLHLRSMPRRVLVLN